MKYHALFVIFEKVAKIFNRRLLQIIGGALRVNSFQKFVQEHYQSKLFRNTIRALTHLDPDQDQSSVGPDVGPICLQRLSADRKVARKELTTHDADVSKKDRAL